MLSRSSSFYFEARLFDESKGNFTDLAAAIRIGDEFQPQADTENAMSWRTRDSQDDLAGELRWRVVGRKRNGSGAAPGGNLR